MEKSSKIYPLMAGLAIGFGILGDGLLRAHPLGLNLTLWTVPIFAVTLLLSRLQKPLPSSTRWLIAVAALFSLTFVWRDSLKLKWLSAFAVFMSFALAAQWVRELRVRLAGIATYVLALLEGFVLMIQGAPVLAGRDCVQWTRQSAGKTMRQRLLASIRGLLIAVPLVIVFGGLFFSADVAYRTIISDIFDLRELVKHAAMMFFCAWLAGSILKGLLGGSMTPLSFPEETNKIKLGAIEAGVVMTVLDLLFLSFVVVQFRYLFGGVDRIREISNLTYAEYARAGFFQLCAVAALVLGVLLLGDWLLRDAAARGKRVFRALAGFELLMLAVVMTSAFVRMKLYQDAYGLTELRFYVTAFMVWLVVVFAWFALTVLRGKREEFAFGAFVTGLAAILVLHSINPDAHIVNANAARLTDGKSFDARYAASLSADAVPALVAVLPELDESERSTIARKLRSQWLSTAPFDWRTWSWARGRAARAVRVQSTLIESSAPKVLPEILNAEYGAGNRWVDATRQLQERVKNGELLVKVNNNLAGDPANGRIKELKVEYRFGGKSYSKTVREGEMLRVPDTAPVTDSSAPPSANEAVDRPPPGISPPGSHALRFDGRDDLIHIAPTAQFDLTGSLTISAWVNVHPECGEAPIFYRGDMQRGHDPYQLNVYPPKVRFIVDGGQGDHAGQVMATAPLDAGWHLWTGVRDVDAGIILLYKDGQLVGEAPDAAPYQYETSEMYNEIGSVDSGAWGGSWGFFKGELDQLSVWNVARKAGEIQRELAEGLKGDEPGLVALWDFEEGDGQTAKDRTGNGNDVTLGSSAQEDSHDPTWVAVEEAPAPTHKAQDELGAQPLEPIQAAENLPGTLIFQGRYVHRSRGSERGTASLWVKRQENGAISALSHLSFFNETALAVGDINHRPVYYAASREPVGRYPAFDARLNFHENRVVQIRHWGDEKDDKEFPTEPGALFDLNSRPDPYAVVNILVRRFAVEPGQSKEFIMCDWGNSEHGQGTCPSYRVCVEHKGKEAVTVPAGTFEANHLVLTQLTSADTWFKKRAGHVTDFWVLDNDVIVRILRHREPYEILLADYQSPEPLPGLLERREAMPPAGKLSGVVLDAATGQPVERSRVRVTDLILSGGVKAAHDALGKQRTGLPDGRFELDGLRPGTATLEVSAPGYAPKEVPDVSVESGKTTSGIEVVLSPARDTFDELTAALAPGTEGIVVEAMVDGDSELHVTSEGVYWKCAGGYSAKPGLHEGYEEPTYLNGAVWWPRWGIPGNRRCHDQTELAKFSVPAVDRLEFELIAVGQPRGAEGINRRDPVISRHEGGEFVVSIPDRNSGWQWYRFRIYAN